MIGPKKNITTNITMEQLIQNIQEESWVTLLGKWGHFKNMTYESQVARKINSWYDDHAFFVYPSSPWFDRGTTYYCGTESGMFAFGNVYGSAYLNSTFRIVLV